MGLKNFAFLLLVIIGILLLLGENAMECGGTILFRKICTPKNWQRN